VSKHHALVQEWQDGNRTSCQYACFLVAFTPDDHDVNIIISICWNMFRNILRSQLSDFESL
jgi:hypothetical protein